MTSHTVKYERTARIVESCLPPATTAAPETAPAIAAAIERTVVKALRAVIPLRACSAFAVEVLDLFGIARVLPVTALYLLPAIALASIDVAVFRGEDIVAYAAD